MKKNCWCWWVFEPAIDGLAVSFDYRSWKRQTDFANFAWLLLSCDLWVLTLKKEIQIFTVFGDTIFITEIFNYYIWLKTYYHHIYWKYLSLIFFYTNFWHSTFTKSRQKIYIYTETSKIKISDFRWVFIMQCLWRLFVNFFLIVSFRRIEISSII